MFSTVHHENDGGEDSTSSSLSSNPDLLKHTALCDKIYRNLFIHVLYQKTVKVNVTYRKTKGKNPVKQQNKTKQER